MGDPIALAHVMVRWLHVFSAIVWVGHLVVASFVMPFVLANLERAAASRLLPQFLPRALFFIEWSAMLTLIAGVTLFVLVYLYAPGAGLGPTANLIVEGRLTGRAMWILLGMLDGFVMWWNVWMAIAPAQRAVINALARGLSPDPSASHLAASRLRVNMYLTGPLLFTMLAPSHLGTFRWGTAGIVLLIAVAVTRSLYWVAARVGKSDTPRAMI